MGAISHRIKDLLKKFAYIKDRKTKRLFLSLLRSKMGKNVCGERPKRDLLRKKCFPNG